MKKLLSKIFLLIILLQSSLISQTEGLKMETNIKSELATIGAGCFWCVEAIFQNLDGVSSVVSGYAGGRTENPTYQEVCSGETGHAEVCQLTFDPNKISFEDLLEVFWSIHDPTTLNRQGADIGTQYRSVIFYHSDKQKSSAERLKKVLDESGAFENKIVTEIVPAEKFYPAEDYHQNYFDENKSAPYCSFVIRPKLEKFKEAFNKKLK